MRQIAQRQVELSLARTAAREGEARSERDVGAEMRAAEPRTQSSDAGRTTGPKMEEVVERDNMFAALDRVKKNKGAPGPDGMTVGALPQYLKQHWPAIRAQLLAGTYQPQPVRRVEIPKAGGGQRQLGIPTVVDRLIQQATLQVLQRDWDGSFSDASYGFRPRRSAHQAIAQAQQYVQSGLGWVADIDLEKFFDRVQHDVLMSKVAKRVDDKRILKLIRGYLQAGAILADGVVHERSEGTPQGGPLSPLLANLLLDGLDKELERRGHRFVRYADDCNIYVRSERAGHRVMASITHWLEHKLRLRVNPSKSAVALAITRDFLGFRLGERAKDQAIVRQIAPEALARARTKVRALTPRRRGDAMAKIVREVGDYLRGWWGYFRHAEQSHGATSLASWTRRRLRQIQWIHWKTPQNRRRELARHGCKPDFVHRTVSGSSSTWRMARSPGLHYALNNAYWRGLGLPDIGHDARTA